MRPFCHHWLPRIAVFLFTAFTPGAFATTYTVTVTNDSGAGSLRQAILDANANGGADTIDFNITTGVTIPAATNLPPITDPVTIDATTQPGWISAPIIELNGTNIGGAGQDGFKIWAGSTTIRGLVINRFTGDGIEIATNGNNVIEGCYIGTGLSGTNDLGNTLCGVFITNSTFNVIGGTNTAQRNVISGNNQQGILVGGSNSLGNQILGNLIGLGANGSNTVANSQNGIHIHNSRSNIIGGTVTGARNVISGNSQAGIRVELAQAFGNQILGNYIGLEISGGTNRANAANGITLINAPSNYVGNATSEGRNVIAANTGIGMSLSTANYTTIQGNYIGTSATGTLDRGNTTDGINVATSLYAIIGGTNAGEANLISGNTGDGLELSGTTTSFAMVLGNLIGTDITGTNALGNSGHGIQISATSATNTIGGIATGQPNTIAFNGTDGVFVGSGSNNVVRGNAIFSNTDQGIDIGTSGVTANDPFDTDTGANQLMNFPVLVIASNSPTDTVIAFRMNSWTNITVDIDFYANVAPDGLGNGEGQFYLGSTNVQPLADSNFVFAVSLPTGPLTGRHITATATDQFGNTSEFSPTVGAVSSVAGQIFTVINTNSSGAGSLRQAIIDANLAVTAGDRIEFNIPGSGPFTISPTNALPALLDPATTIDAYTQSGAVTNSLATSNNAVLMIRLDGASAGTGTDGLKVTSSNCVVRGLSITRFNSDGIEFATNGNSVVEGCFIGITPDGTNAANSANGILVNNVAGITIGGTNAAARNVISANASDGIEIAGINATSTLVQGNLIGLAPNGVTDRGNGADGVFITGAPGNAIGGAVEGVRNVISRNASDGIGLTGAGAFNNVVLGNFIGTDYTGAAGAPNDAHGVNIAASVTGTTIGSPAAGNVIAFNLLDGVSIPTASPAPTNNAIRANSIFSNGDLGIDLQTNGIAFNDLTDADTGANNQQNHPVLTAVTNTGADTTFHGLLNGPDLSTFTFDFFANTISDASGNGEGQFYLGSTNFTTGVSISNTHAFALMLPVASLPGRYITATATDASGNSSEFSPALAAVSTVAGATYTVINTNDSGAGSLREAILFANTNINAGDTIAFNIPGAGEQIIRPLSQLPVIIDPVTIDGYTQPGSVTNSSITGFNGTLLVRLEAASAGLGVPGLFIAGGGSIVRGLMIARSPGHGITIATNGNNIIAGCIIGLDSSSADVGGTNNGILINISSGNTIGGTNVAARNVISGNTGDGIEIIGGAATSNVILGNLIGTDLLGTTNRANNDNGILVTGGASGTIIGASTGEIRNVIAGNTDHGISLSSAAGTVILGNYIGTDATGTLDRGNGLDGINVSGGTNSIIGGSGAGEGNLISGNDDGIEITAAGSTNVVVLGNFIGTDATGSLDLGNDFHGVNFSGSSRFNRLGGSGSGERNVIAFNGSDGVSLATGSTNVAIRANAIYNNGDLGIDLGTTGVTANDVGDNDTGANLLQNFPVLAAVTNDLTGTLILGTLNSATNASFALDFFSTVALEPTGHGEGQAYLGSTNITTDGTGNAAFTVQLTVTNLTGRYITATATDANGNTSEFSSNVVAVSTLAGVTFTVINTNDSGAGSLREAINNANTNITRGDTIAFNIPGAGVQTISPITALPTITDPVTIDGYTQPGSVTNSSPTAFNGTVLIRISGSNAPSNTDNLKFTVGNNTVRGLVIISALGTSGDGLDFSSGGGNVVEGCLIGVDVDGSDRGNGGNGILFTSSPNNLIGGTTPALRNVISGNAGDGIEFATACPSNSVIGNLIGTDLTGLIDRGNTAQGLLLSSAPFSVIGGTNVSARNVISGNSLDAIELSVGSSNVVIQGNYLGLDANGANVLTTSGEGINNNGARGTIIGGATSGAGNVIAGNVEGILLNGFGSTECVIQGNYIGTDATGTLDRGNTLSGIHVSGGINNTIGGSSAGAGNLISGNNTDGITITSTSGTNQVYGNWIGLGSSGNPLGNSANGVLVNSTVRNNRIGGTGAGEANTIANNSGDGVQISGTATNNAIRANLIYNNGDLGIDLGTSGVSTNDLNDTDTGANQSQNFPVITAATNGLSTIIVEGTLNSWPLANFNVDIFANVSVEPSGAGEGQVYLGSTVVTTDGSGNGGFSVSLPGTLTGRYITATATDTNGNTSEFSAQFFATSDIPVTNFIVINTNDSGPGSLRDAITNANGYISAGNDTITFAIPGPGPHIISPASALPQLSDPVTIDGFTQTNAAANTLTNGLNTVLQIQLNGSGAGAGVDGLRVAVSGCIIRGLAITGFTQDGVDISQGSGSDVEGCFIGMSTDGVTAIGNSVNGINLSSSNAAACVIGGGTPAARNLISGNGSFGVSISSSAQNIVAGNLVGTDISGTLARPNAICGVLVSGSTARLNVIGGTNAADRNVLSGNGAGFSGAGVRLGGCVSNYIYGNYCGVSVTGTSALANGENGIEFINAAHTNFIGGPLPGAGNVLSGNPNAGVYMFGGGTSIGNAIQGNRIGTDASGMTAIPNFNRGILVGTARLTRVGGANPGEGNLISGNSGSTGVEITCCGTVTNWVLGNWIGTDATGTNALPNYIGIVVYSPDNFIGGTNANDGNRIWFNYDRGLQVDIGAQRVAILGNSFQSNGGLAIDLDSDGVTLNDAGDSDTGSNNRQNFPVLAWGLADTNANTLTLTGTFNSASNSTFRLEFFDNTETDPTGYGEGRDFLGATNVTTDGSGNASFTLIASPTPAVGHFITATATTTNSNTSEFSTAAQVVPFDSVDLQITLAVSTNPASIALGFNYTNTIVNAGPTNATGVLVTNFLPAGVSVISSNASQGTISTTPGLVIWNVGNLDYSSNAVLVLSVNGGTTGLNTNTAVTVAAEDDHTLTNNTASFISSLGLAGIAVSLIDSSDPVVAGQSLTLVTTVTNLGPDPATLVTASFTAISSLVVTSTVTSQGGAVPTGGTSYDWNVGSIPVGGSATFTVIGIPTGTGADNSFASASAAEADDDFGDNSTFATTTVDPGVGIFQLDSASYGISESGSSASVTILRNAGSSGTVTVDLFTGDLSATAGSDYVATNLTLTFTNGETFQTVSIPVIDDLNPECNELFSVALTNATGGAHAFLITNATVLIFDNEIISSGGIALASVNTNGTSGNNSSHYAVPSADGRFIAFPSFAEDLVPGDANSREDVFLFDLTNRTVTLVSANLDNSGSGNRIAYQPRISTDGRFVAFYSESTNLVAGAMNIYGDIYQRDTVAGITRLISVSTNGTGGGNDTAIDLEMTPDGRFIVFESWSTNLVMNDLNGFNADVFLRDTNSATCELISVNGAGTGSASGASYDSVVSGDGRFVAFESEASNLGPSDTNFNNDVYVRDRNTATNYLCSVSTSGGSGNGYSYDPVISSNGVIVLFYSYATNLVTGDTNDYQDIFAYNTTNHTVQLVSVKLGDTSGGNDNSYNARISDDGRHVVFESYASDLAANDLNSHSGDIFLRDLVSGTTTLISVNCDATGGGNSDSYLPAISADGRYITYVSVASDLAPGNFSAGYEQVFRHDRVTGQTVLVSQNTSITGPGGSYSYYPEINADGHIIAFISEATDLVTNSIAVVPNAMFWDATAATTPASNVNLVLAKTASTNSLVEFSALTYTLAVTNLGTLASSSTVVTDALPANLTFISAATSVGTVTNSGSLVTANLGALGITSNALITITVMPTNFGLVTNIALAASPETDSAPADNTGTAIVTITAFPPPTLYTLRTNSQVLILWPSNTPPVFVLETKTNLQPAVIWSSVTNTVGNLGTNNSVTLTPDLSERTRFFRLRR